MLLALLLLLAGQAPPGPAPLLADLLTRAQERLRASDRAGARRDLTDALRLYPESPAVYNFLGVLEAEEGAYVQAEARFREAMRRAPQHPDAYLNLGRLYQENPGQDGEALRKALAAYQSVLAFAPAHSEAAYQSAVLLHALGEFGRSLDHLNRLPPASQERAQVLALRCADHAGRGDRALADQAAERLLRRPELAEADVRTILPTLAAHGRQDLARGLVEALRARGLASFDDLLLLGRLHEDEGDFDRARKILEEAATARPASVEVLMRLARVAHEAKDFKGALGYLAHARTLEPGNAGVHFFFGMVCVNLDLGVEAYDSLKEAVRLEPDNPHFNYALGAVALQRRDPAEAIPYFRRYAALKPADTRVFFALGVAAFKSGDFKAARAELAKAVKETDTVAASNYFLARMAREVEQVRYFKIEVPRAPAKFAATLALAGERVLGIFGGANGLLFIDELARGGCGTMPSGATPEVFVAVYDAFMNGEREKAEALFRHYLPLIYFENSLGGRNFPKELLHMGGIIRSSNVRSPVPAAWDEPTRQRAHEMARQYDLLVLRYAAG